jgi:acetyl-CoA carboxylase biotin carboxylase subunit
VWADTREHAIERMLRALSEYQVGGIRTNIPLFDVILREPAFRAGDLHTGYLDALLKMPGLFDQPPAPELASIAAAAVTAFTKPASAASVPAATSSRWLSAGREDLLR